jgi:hypothetical protein
MLFSMSFASLLTLVYRGQCSTGPQQCCNSVQDSSVPQVAQLLGSLGLQLGAGIPIGVTCSPVTVIGAAGGSSWLVHSVLQCMQHQAMC